MGRSQSSAGRNFCQSRQLHQQSVLDMLLLREEAQAHRAYAALSAKQQAKQLALLYNKLTAAYLDPDSPPRQQACVLPS